MTARLLNGWRRFLRSERGIALPVAMFVTVIGLALAAVPIMASVNSQGADQRDQLSDAALTAADSGAELAVTRQALMTSKLTAARPCVAAGGTTLEAVAATANGWCPRVPTTGSEAAGRGGFSYRVRPTTKAISVVSTGTASGSDGTATRRLLVNASSPGAVQSSVFGNEGVVGVESVTLSGGTKVEGNVGTNGDIHMSDGSKINGCEDVRVGEGGEVVSTSNGTKVNCGVVTGNREYPNVVVPTQTSNGRMFTAGGDTYAFSNGAIGGCASSSAPLWCPTSRVLKIYNSSVYLSGTAPYVFCQLSIEGSGHLIVPEGKKVQIIFDSPESCGLPNGSTQLFVTNGSKIEVEGVANEVRAGFYFVGSPTLTTWATFEGGSNTSNFVLYGPRTNIKLTNGAKYGGAILGKSYFQDGGTWIKPEGSGFNPDENLPVEKTVPGGPYLRGAYIECSSTPNEAEPSAGC
jgi:hypothetical protein